MTRLLDTAAHFGCAESERALATYHFGFVVSDQLFVHTHLVQDLDGRLADGVAAVLVPWELLLLEEKHLATLLAEVVAQCGTSGPCPYDYDIVMRSLLALSEVMDSTTQALTSYYILL